ncbi:GNAT family N-acetyltransferase [Nocardioides sp. dk4132]|uniref:GNAT family N-acetyltransferase n=1 Tax=unclassified Nocardioides TaxID=2615069 RepID=UPI0012961A3C|nr:MULTISPECIES: GNAT family N-acetyltransferase [unclassified Nocardioides]MQW77056.1 GNAT family N-acetyltransferase [Nocardioides sp. dk4132]QGA09461.1 GNAT family N-acetyltransferase [Nocardioides sp. dk884]
MSRKVVRLTVDHLAELGERGERCASCLFWELDPVRRERVPPERAAAEKEAWVSELLRDWGSCGRVVLVEGRPVGWAIYAPAAYVPGAAAFPTAPVSPDAVLLTTVHVDAEYAGGGLGRMLIQGVARDLVQRGGIAAVEAFATTRPERRPVPGLPGLPGLAGCGCVVPAGFLGSVGFKTQRAHPLTPRMRMSLRAALTWRDEVEAAIGKLVGAVRPGPRTARPPTPTRVGGASRAS